MHYDPWLLYFWLPLAIVLPFVFVAYWVTAKPERLGWIFTALAFAATAYGVVTYGETVVRFLLALAK